MIAEGIMRFWAKVDQRGDDECWPWIGARTSGGYGQLFTGIKRPSRNQTRLQLATHIALALAKQGRPTKDHVAMHSCDNPRCVNPKHLRWGTAEENRADMIAKGRTAKQIAAALDMDNSAAELGDFRTGNTKLTIEDIRYIRSSLKTSTTLADELGVTNQCISNIRLGRTWRGIN